MNHRPPTIRRRDFLLRRPYNLSGCGRSKATRCIEIIVSVVLLTLLISVSPGAPLAQANGTPRHRSSTDKAPKGICASDWSTIRRHHEQHCHRVFTVDGGHEACNPGQQWQTLFDGRGFTTRPDAGGWQWGLELRSYGFAGDERVVVREPQVNAESQRVTYDWDDTLQEWFVNDSRGLEHGFTLKTRPSAFPSLDPQSSTLNFLLVVRGGLHPEVQADGRGVRFVDAHRATVLTYAALTVLDAEGRILPARFEPMTDGLRLAIDERGACYPLTIDPIAQQAYLKASNTAGFDSFGHSVAVWGDTVVIGAQFEDSSATGVNGNESDNNAADSGAAYVFVRNGTNWTQQAYLKASNAEADDRFGYSVAVSGDTVVVGAVLEDSNATGVNGNQTDNSAQLAGAAYVFVRNGTNWTQQAYLKASNTEGLDGFGWSVAVWGDTVVVGAHWEDGSASGVNGNQNNNNARDSGAAYVFVRSGTNWIQQAYLKASNTGANDEFGYSVAVSGDTIVVGAYHEDSSATGVNGNQSDNTAADSGAAYVFVRNGTNWTQQAYLKASNTEANDDFGWSMAMSGDTVLVGAVLEDSSATGVNGDQSDNGANASGAAYVFVHSGTNWTQQAYLKASITGANDDFGVSVAVSGDMVIVGAHGEDSSATGVNGNQDDNGASASGAAYVFVRSGTNWTQQAYFKASNPEAFDSFGVSVAVSGDTAVVGASGEDSNATGVNGNQSDDSAPSAGAAYLFTGLALGPRLEIGQSAGSARVFWPLSSAGFVLESTTALGSTNWQLAIETVVTNNNRLEVTVPFDQVQRYFRLRKP